MKITGVLLAGGESRRFGKSKAFAVHNGKYFFEKICGVLKSSVEDIVIVSRPEWREEFGNWRMIEDDLAFRGKGPLAGLYSAMKEVPSEWYFVLACDVPCMDQETVERITQKMNEVQPVDAIVPKVDGRLQPLAALYHSRTFPILESLLIRDIRKVKMFLDEIDVYAFQGLNPICFQNVNTQEDFARLKGERDSE